MACIIYYQNLDYDKLPTARKKARTVSNPNSIDKSKSSANSYIYNDTSTYSNCTSTSTSNNSNYNSNNSSYTSNDSSYTSHSGYNNNNNNNSNNNNSYSYTNSTNTYSNPRKTNNNTYRDSNSDNSRSFNSFNGQNNSFVFSNCYNDDSTPVPKPLATNRNVNKRSYDDCITSSSQKVYERPDDKLLLDTLKKYFNFTSFRKNQLEAVNATCAGLDTLILMPTGGGKSICYQLPAILTRGITIVVSPLKSLIDDQVERLRSLNIRTSALFGETSEDEASEIFFDLKAMEPKHKLLYVTPEKINCSTALINLFRSLHSRNLLARFVIDEAHCVSMWGADFRPDYRKLGKLRQLFSDVPIMALTATAPLKVRDDIFNQLQMNRETGVTLIQSFNRPNLKFEVRVKSKGCLVEICNVIRNQFQKQCGIIYCLSRSDCETVSEGLREHGITSAPYHAGLASNQRKKVFQAWSSNVFQVVCATIAFGMGIDKSNVRFVIHYSVPKSVEGYYQEAGRAGRDGQFAHCILYFSKSDLYRMKSMLSKGFGRKAEDKQRDKANLDHMISYVENRNECRRAILLRYLGEQFKSSDCISHIRTACDNCLAKRNSGD